MRIAVYDPNTICVGVKLLFPNSQYFTDLHIEPGYPTFSQENFTSLYGFEYRQDTYDMNTFDLIVVVLPYYDLCPETKFYKPIFTAKVRNTLENISVPIILFDYYDYNYDPHDINIGWNLEYICVFKRYYSSDMQYRSNVYPFPFMVFGRPCPLFVALNTHENIEKTNNGLFWSGSIYVHSDPKINHYRNRVQIFNQIQDLVDVIPPTPYKEWFKLLQTYDKALDLRGVGDPNQRSLEILAARTLRIYEQMDVIWPFEDNDTWPNTSFSTREELINVLNTVTEQELVEQNRIFDKYFNIEWLRNYIFSRSMMYLTVNVVLITSVCRVKDLPYSYSNTRSVFTADERFEQLQKTIQTVQNKIPNCYIFLVECSSFSNSQISYLQQHCNAFYNLYGNEMLEKDVHNMYRAFGCRILVKTAMEKIFETIPNIHNMFVISGRYFLHDQFDISQYNNNKMNFYIIDEITNNINTCFYKIPSVYMQDYYKYLQTTYNTIIDTFQGSNERYVGNFVAQNKDKVQFVHTLGVAGYVTVCGSYYYN